MSIIENIKEACRRKGISVKQMEKLAELSEHSVYKWDRNEPGVKRVARAAAVLDTTVDELLNERKEVRRG